jgi:tubulin polyglutamylase TTLL1/tubulin monoglycylase TTLL3/8
VFTKIDANKREYTFEVFGLDFMIDESFKPWLIEINTNPCLELSCSLLGRIIPVMIENAFKIALDPLFPPPPWPISKRHLFQDNNQFETNKFELVFDEEEDAPYLRTVLNLMNQPNSIADYRWES